MARPQQFVNAASASGKDPPISPEDPMAPAKEPTTPAGDSTTPADAGRSSAEGAALEPAEDSVAAPEVVEEANAVIVPRASGQPICAVVEEHGVARVHAFARRWRSYLYQHVEKRRSWLAPHDLCAMSCTGLTSRCLRMMEREGFLCAVRPPATPAAK